MLSPDKKFPESLKVDSLDAPHPHWPHFFKICKAILTDPSPGPRPLMRLNHLRKLATYAALQPVRVTLWNADKLFFNQYQEQQPKKMWIISLPRSGSTLLHSNLIDSLKKQLETGQSCKKVFGVRLVEWHFPYIVAHKFLEATKLKDTVANSSFFRNNKAGKEANKKHGMRWGDIEEDGEFFRSIFCHPFVSTQYPYDSIRDRLTLDSLPDDYAKKAARWHNEVVKKIGFLQEANIYIGKEVLNPEWIELLSSNQENTPLITISGRDFDETVESFLELNRQSSLSWTGIDPKSTHKVNCNKTVTTSTSSLICREDCESGIESWEEYTRRRMLEISNFLNLFFSSENQHRIITNFTDLINNTSNTTSELLKIIEPWINDENIDK